MICMFSKDRQKSHCILLKKCLYVQLQSTPKEVSVLKLLRKGSTPIEHEPYFVTYYRRKQLHQWGS